MLAPWFQTVVIFLFWPLVLFGLFGSLRYFKSAKNRKEAWLWYGPVFFLLVFFIFGRQVWDALTLRYLTFFQFFIPALLAFCALSANPKKWHWKGLLILWMALHGSMLVFGFYSSSGQHPAQHIASRLEEMGLKAGFSEYWVSEPVRYFSKDRVLLNPYDVPPLSRRVEWASKNTDNIALVWLEGLDRPNLWGEVTRQIQSLNYHPLFKQNYPEEGWSVTVWKKDKKHPPVH